MMRYLPLAFALILTACSGGSESDNAADPVALVKVATATQGSSGRQVTVYGAAEPGPGAKMSLVALAEARVIAIDAPVGTPVGPGQVVARLAASATTRADSAKAASDAAAADKALARAIRLRRDGLMSDADVETARAAAVAANALRASFADRAGSLTLRAPAAGVVDTIGVAPGDLLQPGAAVASITRLSDARVRFGVDPDLAQSIRPGMTLQIAASGDRAPLSVPVESVSTIVDPQTKQASVFARVTAASGIVAGETLTATIDLGGGGTALSVPYAALLDDAGQPYVYVVANGVAHRRNVEIQPANGDRVTILKGVKPGEQVVTDGGTALEDGMKVRTR